MTFDEYQEQAKKTNIYPEPTMMYDLLLGLGEETGEVQGKIKKFDRDNQGKTISMDCDELKELNSNMFKELGDVLWYIANIAEYFGFALGDVASGNIAKLKSRMERNKLTGNGDDR